jgi:hypothetical protein
MTNSVGGFETMPRYKCHKVVHALKIEKIEGNKMTVRLES